MLISRVFGRGVIPPNIGSKGGASGPLRGRHSGKGRAVPEAPSVDPSWFAALNPFCGGSITREMLEGKLNAWFASNQYGARRMG